MTDFKSVLREKADCKQSKAIPTFFFFFRLASNAFPDIGSVSRTEYVFGLIKCTIYCKKNIPVFVPVFLYAVTMLIFHIKRIISSEKWFNYVVTLFFFFDNAKNLGRSDDAKRRKKSIA